MSDLITLFRKQEITARWRVELENASARLQLAQIEERIASLISQHEPVASLHIDRDKLRLLLDYLQHGNLSRLESEISKCI